MKNNRRDVILEIINETAVSTQEQLIGILAEKSRLKNGKTYKVH